LPRDRTIMAAEAAGIARALRDCESDHHVRLIYDSQAAVKAITGFLDLNTRKQLRSAARPYVREAALRRQARLDAGQVLEMIHQTSHTHEISLEARFNAGADQLAREGMRAAQSGNSGCLSSSVSCVGEFPVAVSIGGVAVTRDVMKAVRNAVTHIHSAFRSAAKRGSLLAAMCPPSSHTSGALQNTHAPVTNHYTSSASTWQVRTMLSRPGSYRQQRCGLGFRGSSRRWSTR